MAEAWEMRKPEIKRVLITGGAGFIGSHTADAVIRAGYKVRILDLLDPQIHGGTTSFPGYMHPDFECLHGDVRNPRDVDAALDATDAVFHFAALTGVGQSMYDIRNYVDTNCTGTATLLEAIIKREKQVRRLVLASSRAVYGEGTHECQICGIVYPRPRSKPDLELGKFASYCPNCSHELSPVPTSENRPLFPISVYGWTKKQQEEQCEYVAKTFGIPVSILRYFNVYGSRQSLSNPYTGVVSIFYSRLKAGQPISLYEGGKPMRDFIHVSDVARANLLALESGVEPVAPINVGTGRAVSILDVANTLGHACAITPRLEDRGEFRVGDINSCYADLKQAVQLLGFRPQMSLKDGMEEFVEWAQEQKSTDLYQTTVDELQRHGLFGRARNEGERR